MPTGRRTTRKLGRFSSACVLGALALSLGSPFAAETGIPIGTASDFPPELVLRPESLPYELASAPALLDRTNTTFLKEPALSTNMVFRRVLRFANDTNTSIALIWDRPASKLYLDLNHNLDLTDDPAGVFSSTSKGFTQTFTNVTLPLNSALGLHPAKLDLRLTSGAAGNGLQAYLIARCIWQAKVAVAGEEWQLAVLDNPLDRTDRVAAEYLLLRPWALRKTQVSLRFVSDEIVPFPGQLFWAGRAFRLECRFVTEGGTPLCKLQLTPQEPPLVELKLSGESLHYALLRATNGYTVVLGNPPGPLRIPAGVYSLRTVWLKKGAAEAYRFGYQPLVLNATAATNLALGGPLTNSVTLNRSGRKLVMNYQLKGVDGGSYRLVQQDQANPPEFTVYRSGKKVQAGRFQYG